MAETTNLGSRIEQALSSLDEQRKKFQAEETQKHKEWQGRLDKIGEVFDSLRSVWKPRFETLIQKFGDKVSAEPSISQSTREVTMNFNTDIARIRLRFRATADSEIHNVILQYDLEIIPILMQFEAHSELEMPLDAVDPNKVAKWIDDRILDFVNTYVKLHENQFYLKEQMVQDPVTGTQFPRQAAGAILERDGHTHYFVSEETRREFEAGAGNAQK